MTNRAKKHSTHLINFSSVFMPVGFLLDAAPSTFTHRSKNNKLNIKILQKVVDFILSVLNKIAQIFKMISLYCASMIFVLISNGKYFIQRVSIVRF